MILLSVIGELRNPTLIQPLRDFIGNDTLCEDGDAGTQTPPTDPGGGIKETELNTCALLRAKAVEMLAYYATADALGTTMTLASTHPTRAVRVAAIDAYMFNSGDTSVARNTLLATVRSGEQKLVGLARRTRTMDIQYFDSRVRDFYANNPSELPSLQPLLDAGDLPRAESGTDFSCTFDASAPPAIGP